MIPVRFSAEARDEIAEAATYYGERHPGLGRQFIDEIDDLTAKLSRNPHGFPGYRVAGIFKAFVPKFPYTLYFTLDEDTVRVLALSHQSRRPDYWKDRLK